jgi:hypothetical protein
MFGAEVEQAAAERLARGALTCFGFLAATGMATLATRYAAQGPRAAQNVP